MRAKNYISNFLRLIFRSYMSARVKNTPSIISRDCCGGVFYHDCKQKFLSPTIGLYFSNEDFLLFCKYIKAFVCAELKEVNSASNYPVGMISTDYGNIEIRFLHYNTFQEASAAWQRRTLRIDYDNIYIVLNAGPLVPKNVLETFQTLDFKHKILLSSGVDTNQYPCCYNMKCYEKGYNDAIVRHKNSISPSRYMYEFDFVSFVNER